MAFQDCQWHIAAPIPDFESRLGSGNRPYRPLQGHSSGQKKMFRAVTSSQKASTEIIHRVLDLIRWFLALPGFRRASLFDIPRRLRRGLRRLLPSTPSSEERGEEERVTWMGGISLARSERSSANALLLKRRVRDSNPRYLAVQRFSRPPP